MRCAVFGCNVNNQCKTLTPGIKYFSFPKEKEFEAAWKHACKRKDTINVKNARVCSKHFSDDDYERNLKHELLGYTPNSYRYLKRNAVPSKNVPNISRQKETSGRVKRQESRQQKRIVEDIVKGLNVSNGNIDGGTNNVLCGDGPNTSSHSIPEQVLSESTQDVGVNTDADERDKIIVKLKEKITFLEERQHLIGKLFSEEQLKKLEGSKTRLRWTVDDISKAMVIYSSGPRAYRLLLEKGYPFPAASCLRSWRKKIKIAPGILKKEKKKRVTQCDTF